MQDRFKIRVFDTLDSCYVKIAHLDFNPNGNISQMKFIKLTNQGSDGEYVCDQDQLDKFIFEQCTGMKDKNGKLIYEGDIVQYKDYYEGFLVGTFQNKVDFNHGSFFPLCEDSIEDVEVIGNFNENPELVKDEKQ